MFIQDLRGEFFNFLAGKRVVIIANFDIDSIAASKILQTLFRNEQIMFTFVPVMGMKKLQRTFDSNKNNCNIFILINCGGCIDLVEFLTPPDDAILFVCDAHRPLHLCNIYSESQVRILGDPSKEEDIPKFDEIFRDTENDENDDEDENIENSDPESNERGPSSNVDNFEQRLIRNREKRNWEKNRDEILSNYSLFSYYAKSTALMFFDLAYHLSKDSLDMLWWAIVGITEQLLLGKIESTTYTLEAQSIQSHVSRLNSRSSANTSAQTAIRITYENDLHLALYRHWSVRESIINSLYSACQLKLWTLNGRTKLDELLVEMGLPIVQAKQQFNSMDLLLKKDFFSMVEKTANKFNLNGLIFGSFTLQYGYKNRFSASDYVYSMMSLLEQIEHEHTVESCFLQTLESLSRNRKEILESGIEKSKQLHDAIFKQVKTSLESKLVHSSGSFLYIIFQEENIQFSSPYGLTMLARFILQAFITMPKSRKLRDLPLIASIPIDSVREINLMIGIPPVGYDTKNLFGEVFKAAAIKSNAAVLQDFFDTNIIQIKQGDCNRFFDALTVTLSNSN